MKHKHFELDGCYEHMGGSKLHMIAVVQNSLMWMADKDYPSLIGESRDGSLQPCSSSPENGVGWYQINKKIFIEDYKPETFVISKPIFDLNGHTIGYDYNYAIKAYPGKILMFSLKNTNKFLIPMIEDDPPAIINYFQLNGLIQEKEVIELEKLFFERL